MASDNELAILITIEAMNRATAGLAEVQKQLGALGASTARLGGAAGTAGQDLETMGDKGEQAFADTEEAAKEATTAIDEFGEAARTATDEATEGLQDAAGAMDDLADSTEEAASQAEQAASAQQSLWEGVALGASAAAEAGEDASSSLSDASSATDDAAESQANLSDSADDAAASQTDLAEGVALGAGASTSAAAAHEEHAAALDDASDSADAAALSFGKAGSAANSMLTKVGKWVTLGGIAVLADGVKTFADQQTLANKLVTTGGLAAKTYTKALTGTRKMSGQVAYGTTTLLNSLYLVTSAGYNKASEALKIQAAAAKGAKEENATLVVMTTAVTSAMKKYSLHAKTATSVTNEFLETTSHGKMNLQTLASAIPTVLANAKALGVGLPQVLGAIATQTAQGTSAQEAAFQTNALMTVLAKPSQQQLTLMQQMGLTPVELQQQIKKSGLTSVVTTLNTAVMSHMGKTGLVMLTTYKKANVAMKDAKVMMESMTAGVRKAATSFLQGKMSVTKWNAGLRKIATAYLQGKMTATAWGTIVGHLPVKMQAALSQFGSVVQQTRGFNELLQSGQPAAQTYLGMLTELMGRQDAARAVLELSGTHAKTYHTDVKSITKAGAAHTVLQGWTRTSKTFNVKIKDMYDKLHTTLLPKVGQRVATDALQIFTKLDKAGVFTDLAHGAKIFGDALEEVFDAAKPLLDILSDLVGSNKYIMEAVGFGAAGLATAGITTYAANKLGVSKLFKSKTGTGTTAGTTFRNSVVDAGDAFQDAVDTASSRIENAAEQFSSTVQESAETAGTTLTGDATTAGSTLTGDATTAGSTLTGDATTAGSTLTGDATAAGTTLTGDAGAAGATLTRDAGAAGTTLTGDAGAAGATLTRDAGEAGATLTGDAGEAGVAFAGDTTRAGAAFSGDVDEAAGTFQIDADAGGTAIASGGSKLLLGITAFITGLQIGNAIEHTSVGKDITADAVKFAKWLGLVKTPYKITGTTIKHSTQPYTFTTLPTRSLKGLEKEERLIATLRTKGIMSTLTNVPKYLAAELPKRYQQILTAIHGTNRYLPTLATLRKRTPTAYATAVKHGPITPVSLYAKEKNPTLSLLKARTPSVYASTYAKLLKQGPITQEALAAAVEKAEEKAWGAWPELDRRLDVPGRLHGSTKTGFGYVTGKETKKEQEETQKEKKLTTALTQMNTPARAFSRNALASATALKRHKTATDQSRTSLQDHRTATSNDTGWMDKLSAAVDHLASRINAVGASNSIVVQTLTVQANNPAELQQKLVQESRRSAISSKPTGVNAGTLS